VSRVPYPAQIALRVRALWRLAPHTLADALQNMVDYTHESGLRRLSIAAAIELSACFTTAMSCELSEQAVWPVCRSLSVVANANVISSA
jgi:hypothetical protein